jgi:hypothetical protein
VGLAWLWLAARALNEGREAFERGFRAR